MAARAVSSSAPSRWEPFLRAFGGSTVRRFGGSGPIPDLELLKSPERTARIFLSAPAWTRLGFSAIPGSPLYRPCALASVHRASISCRLACLGERALLAGGPSVERG